MGSKSFLLHQGEAPAKERIVQAAVLRFARHSYRDTSLRDIAADAHADVAYVHRCFGSKRRLFAEVVHRVVEPLPATGADVTVPERVAALTRRAFAREPARPDQVDPIAIVSRSMTDPEAAEVIREVVRSHVLAPLAEQIGDASRKRAALVVAVLSGITLLRNVIGLEELRERPGGELEALVTGVLANLVA